MLVFICHRYLLYNLLDVFVSYFDSAIHLRPVGRRIMVLYLELFIELSDHCVVEIRTIVSNNSLWHAVSTYQIMSDKPRHVILGYCSKRGCLNPLREVTNGYYDETMPIGSGRPDFSDHVDAPHCKGTRSCQDF